MVYINYFDRRKLPNKFQTAQQLKKRIFGLKSSKIARNGEKAGSTKPRDSSYAFIFSHNECDFRDQHKFLVGIGVSSIM